MKLKKLIKDIEGIEVKGPKEIDITGVCSNSKCIFPGNLFVAKRGKDYDGAEFIPEAISSGAKVLVTDIYYPGYKEITQILCKDVKEVEAEIAAAFYEHPSEKLYVVGITGTSGKTTVSYWVKHLLEQLDGPSGLIGSIEYQIGDIRYPPTHTTPDVVRVHKLLKEMLDTNLKAAVMEVTSHALDQGRVQGVRFSTAIFTNLSREHLDYHESMESYAAAKEKLFYQLMSGHDKRGNPPTAIVNADSPFSSKMLSRYTGRTLTYGIHNTADINASDIRIFNGATHLNIAFEGIKLPLLLPYSGRFNIYNFLAAVALGLSRGYPLNQCIEALKSLPKVPGRLESVENEAGIFVFVDYAHKIDALENVLIALTEIKKKRIITLFGCGGDRDPFKRPLMAYVAEKYSDVVIVTNDNPRSEDPHFIIESIVKGFKKRGSYIVEPDRKKAIQRAIEEAHEEDIILLAGKGHENYQIFANQTFPFDDALIAKEFLDQKKRALS